MAKLKVLLTPLFDHFAFLSVLFVPSRVFKGTKDTATQSQETVDTTYLEYNVGNQI